ncbi:MAG: phosphotransferase, partial [Ornithinimicrobium sp.]
MRRSDLALAGIACAAVPGMKPVSVQEVSRGAEDEAAQHQTAIIEDSTGRTWVVRVPLTAVAGAELERNEALVGQLGKHLPFKVPAATGFAALGPEQGRAAVYPYVDGSALNLHHLPPGPGLASAVGRAIAAVHNIASDVFEDYAVPVFDAASHRERCVSEVDRAASTGLVPTGLLARWEEALEAPGLWRFAPTPVHGFLDGWAFLVAFTDDDAATARVVALTQWDHAMVGDPAQDFAILTDHLTPA